MDLEEAVKHIINGEAILFLGAGFSREASNRYCLMKDAGDFSKELCVEMGVRENGDLGQVSNLYLGSKQSKDYFARAQKLIRKLQDLFICANDGYTEAQKTIVCQDWMRIYTTNYDDIVEKVYEDVKQEIVPMTLCNTQNEILHHNTIIHLNGLVRNLDVAKLDNEFKLTTRSYLIENFNKSDVKWVFQQDLRNARAIIFVGTSLNYDIEIQKVVYSIDNIRDKIIFVDKELLKDELPDVFDEDQKQILGKVLYIGTKGLAENIARVGKCYKKDEMPMKLRSFDMIEGKKLTYRAVTDQNKWNLLTFGKIEQEIVYSHLNDNSYLVQRDIINDIVDNIEKEKGKVHIIHSHLGNGKTCIMQYLMCKFAFNRKVFVYENYYSDYEKECKWIMGLDGKKVFFFENYNLSLKALEMLRGYIDSSCTLVMTCRTFLNYNMIYHLARALRMPIESFFEYDVNALSDKEKEIILYQLKKMKLAEFKDIGRKQGMQLLKKNGNQWVDIAVYYFKSDLVSQRLDDIYKELVKDSRKLMLVIGCIINNVVGLNLYDSQLFEVLEIHQWEVGITRDANINEMIGADQGHMELRSSILSLYFIHKNKLYQDVIQIMRKMIWNSDRLSQEDSESLKRQLISISNISELFYRNKFDMNSVGKEGLRDEILNYFGNISDVTYYKKNQFFWLQYAMACMDLNKYEMAENCFKLAYKYASEKHIQSFQIDLQYGRFLLEKGCSVKLDGQEAFKVFKEAHNLWQGVLHNRAADSYYVYKQLSVYESFIHKYIKEYNEEEFNKTNEMIESFIKNIKKSNKLYIRQNEINSAIERLKRIKKFLWENVPLLK